VVDFVNRRKLEFLSCVFLWTVTRKPRTVRRTFNYVIRQSCDFWTGTVCTPARDVTSVSSPNVAV